MKSGSTIRRRLAGGIRRRTKLASRAQPPDVSVDSINWDQLRVFLAVAETGSFTRAGQTLRISQSSISRQIAALEKRLAISLFHRHATGLVFTETGKAFKETVMQMRESLSKGIATVKEHRDVPMGPLKITTSVAFGSAWLTQRMMTFKKLYPDIAVSLLLTDDLALDLSLSEADVAIRFASQTQPNLIQRHLMTIQFQFFASKEYIARRGEPKTPDDLDQHDIVVYGEDMPAPVHVLNWLPKAGKGSSEGPRNPALRVSSTYAIYHALRNSQGIGALPYYISEGSGLVRILPDLESPRADAYLVYPEELRNSRRVSLLQKFLIDEARKDAKLRG